MKLVSIVGARPQFVKVAQFARAWTRVIEETGNPARHLIVHTGQHYDRSMSRVFFDELDIPEPDYHLGVGSGSHGEQTGRMLGEVERALLEIRPGAVVVYGDTNSTVAGALAAAKLNIPTAHVEAGLRSFNRAMPEEINRIVTDHVSERLFAPTRTAMENLRREGLERRAVNHGDVMYDALLHNRDRIEGKGAILPRFGLTRGEYAVVTLHRSENTDHPSRLSVLLNALNAVAGRGLRLVFPAHPRVVREIATNQRGWRPHSGLELVDPVSYLEMLCLVANARLMLTDSGGLQKEAFFLNCPCITLRSETEWSETVEEGGNVLAGVDGEAIVAAVDTWSDRLARGAPDLQTSASRVFGDGDAARRMAEDLLRHFETEVQA